VGRGFIFFLAILQKARIEYDSVTAHPAIAAERKPRSRPVVARMGAIALNAMLTADERKASAVRAAKARWGGKTFEERQRERARGRETQPSQMSGVTDRPAVEI
jgi:hypothetical protein